MLGGCEGDSIFTFKPLMKAMQQRMEIVQTQG